MVDLGLLYVLAGALHLDVYLAATVSFWTSLLVNFLLNKYWTFGVDSNTPQHIVAYSGVVLFNYLFGLAMITLAKDLHMGYMVGKLAAIALSIVWNFLIYKHLVFIDRKLNPFAILRQLNPRARYENH